MQATHTLEENDEFIIGPARSRTTSFLTTKQRHGSRSNLSFGYNTQVAAVSLSGRQCSSIRGAGGE